MNNLAQIDLSYLTRHEEETAQEWVYRALWFSLISGQLQPSQALTIRAIAARLDVSMMPVREALKRLVSEGALTFKTNRRIEVPTLDASTLAELVTLRIALECHAAERALPYVDEAILKTMKSLDDAQNLAIEDGDPTGTIIGNQDFHRALYLAHPNPVAMAPIERVWLQLGPLHRIALASLQDHYVIDRHNEIIEALRAKNPYSLRAAIESDITDGAGYLTQQALLEEASNPNLPMPRSGYTRQLRGEKD